MIEFKKIKTIIEALIFASDSPITENTIKNIVTELDSTQINKIIEELNTEYNQNEHAFQIVHLAGGFQYVSRTEYAPYIKQFYKGKAKSKLSRAALETLAIIAFKQPISRPEIDSIRGVNSDGVVKNLLERNLIFIAGRSESIGRALLYRTTSAFLQYFGVNEISDLPRPKEIEELLGSGQEEFPFASDELNREVVEEMSTLDQDDSVVADDEIE